MTDDFEKGHKNKPWKTPVIIVLVIVPVLAIIGTVVWIKKWKKQRICCGEEIKPKPQKSDSESQNPDTLEGNVKAAQKNNEHTECDSVPPMTTVLTSEKELNNNENSV